jgi:regulator of sirC expression with transglutaminase-like and TPR domain
MIARVEYPRSTRPVPRTARRDRREARRRVDDAPATAAEAPPSRSGSLRAGDGAERYLFGEMRFVGNEMHYEDPRNSFLNEVLERRTGIPITLALLYMEVARRAGLPVEGVNFPGTSCSAARRATGCRMPKI